MADILDPIRLFGIEHFSAALPDQAAQPDVVTTPKTDRPVSPAQKLAADLAQINAANSDPNAQALFNLSRERGNGLTANNQIANDYDKLTPIDFQNRYGRDVYERMVATRVGGREVRRQANAPIEGNLRDIGWDIVSGAAQGIGGVVTLGLSAINDRAAVKSAEFMGSVKEFTDNLQSNGRNQRRYVDALRTELDSLDSTDKFNQDVKEEGKLTASLRRIGRDMLGGVKRLGEDPLMIEQGVSEGVGSLLLAGPLSRGAAAVGVTQKAAVPTAIGILEGGGAFTGSAQEIMAIPHETLLEQSPRYRELLEEGFSPEDAKIELAARAGNVSSAIATPLGAAAGKLVAGFEAAPFARGSARDIARNVASEFSEEAIQSGVGEVAGNIGKIASRADPEQSLVEGVGEATIQGGIFGAGTPVVTQGPGLALRSAAKAAGLAIKYPVSVLHRRAERFQAEAEAESSVSTEQLKPLAQAAAEQAPEVGEAIRTLATEKGAKGEEIDAYISRVVEASQTTEDELRGLPQSLLVRLQDGAAELGRMPNKFESVFMLADIATDQNASQEDRTAAGAFILKSIQKNDKLFVEDTPAFLDSIPHDRPEFEAFATYQSVLQDIKANKDVKQAIKWAQSEMKAPEQDLTGVDLNSEAGQQIVEQTVNLAAVAPKAVNANTVTQLLQADEGSLSLTKDQRKVLRSHMSLLNADRIFRANNRVSEPGVLEQEVAELREDLAVTQTQDERMEFVGKQIENGPKDAEFLSLARHAQGINQAILNERERPSLRGRIQALSIFARSHRNKVEAFNKAIAAGDRKRVPYQSAKNGEWLPRDDYFSVFYNPGTEASQKLARKVYAEALAISSMANNYADQFPEFGFQKVEIPALVPERTRNQIVENENKNRGSSTASSDPVPATTAEQVESVQEKLPLPTPEPVAEPVAEEVVSESSEPVEAPSSEVVEPVTDQAQTEESAVDPLPETVPETVSESDTAPIEPTGPVAFLEDGVIDLRTETEEPPLPIDDRFPLLAKPAGRNFFHEAFRQPAKPKSRMLTLGTPFRSLFNMLSTEDGYVPFLGKKLDYTVDADDRANLQRLVRMANDTLNAVNGRLGTKNTEDDLRSKFENGEEVVVRTRDLRVLNLLEKTEAGNYRYNPELMETAILAGLDWALNAQDRASKLSARQVAEILGIEDDQVTSDQINEFNHGISLDVAKRDLVSNIMKFWGLETNPDVKEDFAVGIVEAVAGEILHGLEQSSGMFELRIQRKEKDENGKRIDNRLRFPGLTKKTFNRVWFDTRSEATQQLVEALNGVSEILSDIALIEKEPTAYSIGKPITQVDKKQLHQSMVDTTPKQKEVLKNVQATPYDPNHAVFDFIEAMGEEQFVTLMSGRDYKKGDLKKDHHQMKLNKNHWKSVQGLQRQLSSSFKNVSKQMTKVRKQEGSQSTFYKHAINSLGRLQMQGLSTPQADKLAREIFMSTKSTLNLAGNAPDMDKFLLTIAQGIGLKTEKRYRESVTQEVMIEAMTEGGKFHPLVQDLRSWLDAKGSIPAGTMDKLKTAKLSMHGVHSLIAVANYQNAKARGDDLSKFETFNYLEADGKTNGPINSLMLLTPGEITPEWLSQVRKGGVFFGKLGKTLNSLISSNEDTKDLYEDTSDLTQDKVVGFGQRLEVSNKPAHDLFQSFNKFLAALNVDVKIEDGELKISRGLTKNPLTITIYGSGAAGIAGNIADELENALYERLSESIETGVPVGERLYGEGKLDEFMTDLGKLASQTVRQNKDTKEFYVAGKYQAINATLQDFSMSMAQKKALRENVKTFLVDHMREAIDERVTNHVAPVTQALQNATQMQSIFLKALFTREVALAIAVMKSDPEKYDYVNGEFLSKKALDEIRRSLMKFSPLIETGSQSYFMSGGESSNLLNQVEIDQDGEEKEIPLKIEVDGTVYEISMPRAFASSLTGDLMTPAKVYGPTLAGVKAIPTIVVGSGDGQMMLNGLSDKEMAGRTLHVFDGLNMPADKIEEFSRHINEAVFKTWTTDANPLRAVADSFAAFLSQSPVEELFPSGQVRNKFEQDALLDMARVRYNKFTLDEDEQTFSAQDAKDFMSELIENMNDLADQLDARRKTYAKFGLSVDQMASGESPFVNEGSIELDPDADLGTIAKAMSEDYRQNLAEIRGNRDATLAVEKETQRVQESVAVVSVADESGAQVMEAKDLPRLAMIMREQLTPTQKEIFRNAAKHLEGSGYQIVFGTPSQLDDWEAVNNADRFVKDQNYYGKTDPISKIILVASSSPETIVHELVHAATFDKVAAFYGDKSQISEADAQTIGRIEGLMQEWLVLDYSNYSEAAQEARRMAVSAILKHMPDPKQPTPAAVNEFMAWVLANQQLTELAKKTKVQNPLFRIVGKALEALKTLIWGAPNKGARVGDNILSNLRFNTRVLMATPSTVDLAKMDFAKLALYQSRDFGNNERLSQLRQRLSSRLVSWMREGTSDPATKLKQGRERAKEITEAKQAAQEIGNVFAHHFPDLGNMQAYSTFKMIQQALMTEVGLNTNALARIGEVYDHVISQIKPVNFRTNDDPQDQQDLSWAQDKFNVLNGVFIEKTDKHGRSSLLSSFLALAMTSDSFRKILSEIEKPSVEKKDGRSLDIVLENTANAALDHMTTYFAGEKGKNVQEALDSLVEEMVNNVDDQRSFIEQRTENGFDKIERRVADIIQTGSDKVIKATSKILKSNKPAPVRLAAGLANITAQMINEQSAEEASIGLTSWFNRRGGLNPARELINDFIGRTRENFPVFDMISKVRAEVQQTRQQFRDELPRILAKKFSRPISATEQTAMFVSLGKTDLAALVGNYGITGSLELVTNAQRLASEIQKTERSIQAQDPQRSAEMISKSKQLGHFMMTGDYGEMLMSNAEAIARLLGSRNAVVGAPAPQLVEDIDRLATLYAIQEIDAHSRGLVTELARNEKDGIEYVTNYLVGQRVEELTKARNTTEGLFNHYKGHIPLEIQQGGSLIIASTNQHARLVLKGYTKVADYEGSSADRILGKRAYYFAPVSGRAPFSQGVLQTVHQTVSGVDPETGYTIGEVMAGRIEDPKIVRLIERQIANQRQTSENLRPVFGNNGKVVAFERTADPAKLVKLNKSTDLAQMIGAWRGRQMEEMLAKESNKQLVGNLYSIYQDGVKERRTNEFVNIANLDPKTNDPILIETVKLIPKQTWIDAREVFGPDEFWVRRDMLLDTFGARQASVGDLFTGETRWNPKAVKEFEKLAVGMFGKYAYQGAVGFEKNVQEVVSNAKHLIVVKSVIVPAANLISNMFQLLNRGVPIRHIIRGVGAKTVEINTYIKTRHREIGLEADLRAAKGAGDIVAIRKLETKIQALKDGYRRMSIWPLIEAGEFSAISNGQVTTEDLALADGKWTNWVERKVAELPDGIRTPVRYALVTRDTALFQGLARSVQYGDFVAKAILYDDLVKRKATGKDGAVAAVNEAFVNYNRLAGRGRQYLESLGLLWFYHYKLRIMKEAVYMLRHNPLRSLMMTMVPVGAPISDNIASVWIDDRLRWSIGPGMLFNSFSLNPWINAVR